MWLTDGFSVTFFGRWWGAVRIHVNDSRVEGTFTCGSYSRVEGTFMCGSYLRVEGTFTCGGYIHVWELLTSGGNIHVCNVHGN